MSAGYNSGLSEYPNKGKLNLKEAEDALEEIEKKIDELVELIMESKRTVVHTGAGISTSCGIPDFRGPKVVVNIYCWLNISAALLITVIGSVDKRSKRRKSGGRHRMVKRQTVKNAHGSYRTGETRTCTMAHLPKC